MSGIVLERQLGKGSYGVVYKIAGQDRAIKYIKSSVNSGLKELGELNNLKRFDHPNILKCFGFTVDSKQLGIILPLATGDMVKASSIRDDAQLTKWFYQIISAVHFMHANSFYHCDIKPANILLVNGNAVISDMGLVGKKNINTDDVCQSYTSPQLLYRREKSQIESQGNAFAFPRSILNTLVFELPSNEYQDDIWALGQTFYLMCPHVIDNLGRNFEGYDKFILDPVRVFQESTIPDIYIHLLLMLLDPVAENRSFNLLQVLTLDLFKDKKALIDGEMVVVHNRRPVKFTDDIKAKFTVLIAKIMNMFNRSNYNIGDFIIQAIDLLYRTYEFAVENLFKMDHYIHALIIIILKINNKRDLIDFQVTIDMKEIELLILKFTDGHLSRVIISDLILPSKYITFIKWVMENPERYEQVTVNTLAQIIEDFYLKSPRQYAFEISKSMLPAPADSACRLS